MDLFVSEGLRVVASGDQSWEERATWLMTEALVGTTAVADFEDSSLIHLRTDDNPWSTGSGQAFDQLSRITKKDWFTALVSGAGELRRASTPRPYWPLRNGGSQSADGRTVPDPRREFARMVREFEGNGYLVEAGPMRSQQVILSRAVACSGCDR